MHTAKLPSAWLSGILAVAASSVGGFGCGDSAALDGSSGNNDTDGPEGGPGSGDGDGDSNSNSNSNSNSGDGDSNSGDGDGDSNSGDGDGDGDGASGDGDGDPPEGCGDGIVDPGEACDDGNNLPGDGCSAHCNLPGELIWELTLDLDGEQRDEIARAVVVTGTGNIAVWVEVDGSPRLANFDLDGNLAWSNPSPLTDRPSLVWGANGTLVCGGRLGSQGITRAFTSSGDELWTTLLPMGESTTLGLARDAADNIVAVGGWGPGPNAVLARFDPRGVEAWSLAEDVAGALAPVAAGSSIWAVRADAGRLEQYDLDGAPGWSAGPLPAGLARDLVADASGHTYLLTEADNQATFSVTRFDETGAEVWTVSHDNGPEAAGGLALLPGGNGILVAGQTKIVGPEANGLLAFYDLDGNILAQDVGLDGAAFNAFYDVAVTPWNYAVAVGTRIEAGQDADLWIRKFEI